ncbi:MAG: hypothetical protein WC297_01275 [Candidatus Paceibacterota bacterium]|jgi:hypothetical protein
MSQKQKVVYPILSQSKLRKLTKELVEMGDEGVVKIDSLRANKGTLALNIKLSHKTGSLNNVYIDGLLGIVGFEFNPCKELDRIYGSTEKYYIFSWKNGLWIARGDNYYYDGYTTILIEWANRLDKETREIVLDNDRGERVDEHGDTIE